MPPHDMLRRLRQFHEGVLLFSDVSESVRFVLDPMSGQPVLPVPAYALDVDDVKLCLPDDGFDNPECLQVAGVAKELNPHVEEACDRHLAYFGKPAHSRFARIEVESVKRLDDVIDGDLVRLANPFRKHEGSLCKFANANPAAIADACERALGTRPDKPLVVGVDPWGLDIRATFGIMRLEFATLASTEEEARGMIAALMQAGRGR